jgi:toxin ParE1/3/4
VKPLHIRPAATADLDAAVDYLLEESFAAAQGLLDATEAAFALLARRPGLGSPRFAGLLPALPLRSWPITGYPYLVFYLDTREGIDILRILHTRRDIPSILLDEDTPP